MKIKKGEYGYIDSRRKLYLALTILMLLIVIGIFLTGYFYYGTNASVFSIIAALGCLPTGWSGVHLIMLVKASGCSEALQKKLIGHGTGLIQAYDLYMTSYSANYPFSHLSICGRNIAALTESDHCDLRAAEEHIRSMMAADGWEGYSVKVYRDTDKYILRLDQLDQLEDRGNPEKSRQLMEMFCSISL